MENGNKVMTSGKFRLHRLSLLAAGISLGAALAYLLSKALGAQPERLEARRPQHVVDDRGTGQEQAARILRALRDRGFEASDEKLAIALGRPIAEIQAWNSGTDVIDDDVIMKARGIASVRGIRVE